jgi:Xaa-Pro aminopeptidase
LGSFGDKEEGGKIAMFHAILDERERDRRWAKIREAMEECRVQCLLVWGTGGAGHNLIANLRYLANVSPFMEGYLVFPLEGQPTFVTFTGKPRRMWVEDQRGGHPTYSKAISDRLRELHLESASIGVVGLSGYYGELGFPYTTYISLTNDFPKAHFEDATELVEGARRIKSEAEIRCFELGCEVGEKVIQVVTESAEVGVMDSEIKTKMWDTVFLNGCDPASMILFSSGKEVAHGGQIPVVLHRPLEHGDVILTEFDARYSGYKAQFNQPFSVGEPDKEWRKIFNVALGAFNNAFNTLRPGITAGELEEVFLAPIRGGGYTFTNPPFHGLGLSLEQPMGTYPAQPYHKLDTSLRIETGMVIEFEPHVVRADGKKGLTLGSPVLVTETGCRLLSKSWKPEFKVA